MRNGTLLAEASPNELLSKYSRDSLENVFLDLCVINENNLQTKNQICQQQTTHRSSSVDGVELVSYSKTSPNQFESDDQIKPKPVRDGYNQNYNLLSISTLYALILKNFYKLIRSPSVLIMFVLLPMLIIIFFCVSFGQDPHNLAIAIINEELPQMLKNCPTGLVNAIITF